MDIIRQLTASAHDATVAKNLNLSLQEQAALLPLLSQLYALVITQFTYWQQQTGTKDINKLIDHLDQQEDFQEAVNKHLAKDYFLSPLKSQHIIEAALSDFSTQFEHIKKDKQQSISALLIGALPKAYLYLPVWFDSVLPVEIKNWLKAQAQKLVQEATKNPLQSTAGRSADNVVQAILIDPNDEAMTTAQSKLKSSSVTNTPKNALPQSKQTPITPKKATPAIRSNQASSDDFNINDDIGKVFSNHQASISKPVEPSILKAKPSDYNKPDTILQPKKSKSSGLLPIVIGALLLGGLGLLAWQMLDKPANDVVANNQDSSQLSQEAPANVQVAAATEQVKKPAYVDVKMDVMQQLYSCTGQVGSDALQQQVKNALIKSLGTQAERCQITVNQTATQALPSLQHLTDIIDQVKLIPFATLYLQNNELKLTAPDPSMLEPSITVIESLTPDLKVTIMAPNTPQNDLSSVAKNKAINTPVNNADSNDNQAARLTINQADQQTILNNALESENNTSMRFAATDNESAKMANMDETTPNFIPKNDGMNNGMDDAMNSRQQNLAVSNANPSFNTNNNNVVNNYGTAVSNAELDSMTNTTIVSEPAQGGAPIQPATP